MRKPKSAVSTTTNQEDTRYWIEQALRFFDKKVKVEFSSGPDVEGFVTYKASFSANRGYQFIQINPNGKPTWDGEVGKSQ